MTDSDNQPTCFVARPISASDEHEHARRDPKHWQHVQDYLIRPALEAANYRLIEPESRGSNIIHADVIAKLSGTDLTLADLSTLNPNVLFEVGIRTAINEPIVLIAEQGTKLPFDLASINTFFYNPDLKPWNLRDDVSRLTKHLEQTKTENNALWSHFGIALKAATLDPTTDATTAAIAQLIERVDALTKVPPEVVFPQRERPMTSAQEENLARLLQRATFLTEILNTHSLQSHADLDDARAIAPLLEVQLATSELPPNAVRDIIAVYQRLQSALYRVESEQQGYPPPGAFDRHPDQPADTL